MRTDVKRKLEDLKLFDKVDSVDMSATAPTLATLTQYDALLIWADSSRGCSDPTGIGNVIAQYIDGGGGVVQMLPYYLNYSYSNISGDFYTRYALVNQSGSMSYSRGATPARSRDAPGARRCHGGECLGQPVLSPVDAGHRRPAQWRSHRGDLGRWTRHRGGRQPEQSPSCRPEHVRVEHGHRFARLSGSKSDAYKADCQLADLGGQPAAGAAGGRRLRRCPCDHDLAAAVRHGDQHRQRIRSRCRRARCRRPAPVHRERLRRRELPDYAQKDDTLALEVIAKPAAPGKRTTSYKLDTSTPGAFGIAIPLSANGLGPKYQVDPQVINFGGLPVGSMPRSQIVTISNAGGGAADAALGPDD